MKIKYYKLSCQEKREIVRKIRNLLKSEEKVMVAILHGSFIKPMSFRDIDIAIYTGGTATNPSKLETELSMKLVKAVSAPIDIRVIDEAPPWFKLKTVREGQIIYAKKPGAITNLLKESIGENQDLKIKLQTSPRTCPNR